jgi:hypothetical protein
MWIKLFGGLALLGAGVALAKKERLPDVLSPFSIDGIADGQRFAKCMTIYKPREEVFALLKNHGFDQLNIIITKEIPNEGMDWEFQRNGDKYATGRIALEDFRQGATKITFSVYITSLVGKPGLMIAKMWPGSTIETYLMNLKMLAETGEIATGRMN